MSDFARRSALLMLLFFMFCRSAAGAEPPSREQALLDRVASRLLAVCDPVAGWEWPPEVRTTGEGINAYAALIRKEGKLHPVIRLTPDLLRKVIQDNPDRLALVLSHELGHVLNKHLNPREPGSQTPFVKNVFSRNEEFEADRTGVELLVKAGFSIASGKRAILRMRELGLDYSSFEGLGTDHPSWDDRLRRIDRDQAGVWKSMSAFRNGVVFLATEQHGPAERCFEQVTRDFPSCYEAWVNLGFACLMQYCDKLDTEDLRDYNLGPLLTGGFYQRAESIPVRGRDAKLWWKAAGALREGLRLKEDLTLAKADLGLAYLVHPDGKDVGEAARWLKEAADAAPSDRTLDPAAHAGLLVNLGVASLSAGKTETGLHQLSEGEKLGRALLAQSRERGENTTLGTAVLYHRALTLAARKDDASRGQALDLLTQYLQKASPLSLWWPLAYERYADLARALRKAPRERDAFKKTHPGPLRLVTGVQLKSGKEVTLGEDLEDVVKELGKGKEIVVTPGTNMRRLCYEAEGVELLVTDTVLAVCLVGPQAPVLPLRGKGIPAEKAAELRVGMTSKEVEAVLGDDARVCELTTPETYYRYFRDQGLAIRLVQSKVVEVVVVQLARR